MPATFGRRVALARQLLALALGGSALLASSPAVAQPATSGPQPQTAQASTDDATKQLLREGFGAMKRNDLEGARAAFAAAWAHRQHFVVALSLAEVETRLGRFVEAAEHWQYVLGNLPPEHAAKRDGAREQLEECRTHVATLTLKVLPQDATVYIDDKPTADAHLDGELYLEPGTHKVYATKDGRRSTASTVQASPGSRFSLSLVISPASTNQAATPASGIEPAPPNDDAHPSQAGTEHHSLRTPVLISGAALTLLAAGGGTYFAVQSGNAHDDARSAFNTAIAKSDPGIPETSVCVGADRPAECQTGNDKLAEASRLRNYAIGAFITSGVFGAATVATFLIWPASGGGETTAMNDLVVVPTIARGANGVSILGRF